MGLITNFLNDQIERSNNSINQYNADLEKYQQAISDANKAKAIFQKTASNMDRYIFETDGVFQGDAATMFAQKLTNYKLAVRGMGSVMENRVKTFEKRIKEIEGQRRWCEMWNNICSNLLNSIKAVV